MVVVTYFLAKQFWSAEHTVCDILTMRSGQISNIWTINITVKWPGKFFWSKFRISSLRILCPNDSICFQKLHIPKKSYFIMKIEKNKFFKIKIEITDENESFWNSLSDHLMAEIFFRTESFVLVVITPL